MAFAGFNNRPWILLGDFDSLLHPLDRIRGASIMPYHRDFSDCVQSAHLLDLLSFTACFYT